MAVVNSEVWFAPQVRMVDVDLLILSRSWIHSRGVLLAPIEFLRKVDPPQGGLFVAVLTCATTIEFLTTVQRQNGDNEPIARWLTEYIPEFNARIGDQTLGRLFGRRYRHLVAHQ